MVAVLKNTTPNAFLWGHNWSSLQCEQSFNPALKIWFKIKLFLGRRPMTDIGYLFLCGTLGTTVTTWLTVSHYDARWLWPSFSRLEPSMAFMTPLLKTKQNITFGSVSEEIIDENHWKINKQCSFEKI